MQKTQEMRVQSLGQEDPRRREWQPPPVFFPGEPHRQRSLAGYSLWGCKESDTAHRQSTCIQYTGFPKWGLCVSLKLPRTKFRDPPALYNHSYFVLKSSLKQMKQDAAEPNSWRDCPDSPPSARSSPREAGSGIYSDTHRFSLRLGWQLELQWKVTTYFLPNTGGESIRGVKAAKMWTPKGAEVRDDHNYREENSPE